MRKSIQCVYSTKVQHISNIVPNHEVSGIHKSMVVRYTVGG